MVSRSIRLDRDLDFLIRQLSREMGQTYSETVRDLLKMALGLLFWWDNITLKQIMLFALPSISGLFSNNIGGDDDASDRG